MALPLGIYVHDPLPFHRVATPRPVKLADPPGAAAPAPEPERPPAAGPPPASPGVSGPLASALQGIDPSWAGGPAAFAEARAAGAYGLATMGEVAPMTRAAPKGAYEEVSGLGYFPGDVLRDPASLRAYLREEIAAARDAARRERAMSEAAGVEVRIAYDPNIESAVALFPGEEGYDEIKGARAAFARMRLDLERMGEAPAHYADLLRL